MRYDVLALFDQPVFGQSSRASADHPDKVFARNGPDSAARKWLWMLSPAEREATVRLIVMGCRDNEYRVFEVYKGPDIEFVRANGRLERAA